MTSRINKILILGATSGLGEAFARRFHSLGKHVIITGRREDRLSTLKNQLPGIETIQWDIEDLSSIPTQVSSILTKHPDLDSVFVVAGIQKFFQFTDPKTSTDASIISEVNTNVTAPMLLARYFVPHLAGLASSGKHASFILTSSGLAFIPFGLYPVYCPSKAAIHSFCLTLRQQLNSASETIRNNLSIVEVAPPYVDTALDVEHREVVNSILGDHAPAPMDLKEYMDITMAQFEETESGKFKKELGTGFSKMGIDTWREGFGKILEGMHIET